MSEEKEKKEFELHSLKNLLGLPTSEFSFLSKLDVEELALLKNQILTSMQDGQKEIFQTIAKVSRFMPNFLNAKVSHDILGPQITANLSYFLAPKEAISIASHFSTSFFSDIIEHLVPERISEMIALTPFDQMRKAVNELIRRENFFVIGSLMDYTPIESVDRIARNIPNPDHLIQITYNCRDKDRVLNLFQNFGEARISEVLIAGMKPYLYDQIKTIYEHADKPLIEFTRKALENHPDELKQFNEMIAI
ncbi:MAG: hypothetical protein JJT78_13940 [Leptospira sp.]|nr:hypothetical protein [Leptospira sp.]